MAAGYFQKLLNENRIRSVEVRTAGVMTVDGLLATPEAIQIMDAVGVDLRKHRSSKMTPELIKKADLILGMTPFHVQSALRMSVDARGKTFLLKEYTGSDARHSQIPDPMGCTLEVYKKVFGEIRSACQKLLKTDFIKGKRKRTTRNRKIAKKSKTSKSTASKEKTKITSKKSATSKRTGAGTPKAKAGGSSRGKSAAKKTGSRKEESKTSSKKTAKKKSTSSKSGTGKTSGTAKSAEKPKAKKTSTKSAKKPAATTRKSSTARSRSGKKTSTGTKKSAKSSSTKSKTNKTASGKKSAAKKSTRKKTTSKKKSVVK